MELKLERVTKRFEKKVILDEVSYTFERGKIYGLLGRNGAGKTTLFNCIAHNLGIDSGALILDGDAAYDSTEIGYIHTLPQLPVFLTGYEFIKYFMDANKKRLPASQPPEAYLNRIGIAEKDHHLLIRDYSHGMQNKLQMVAALMIQPPVLLLDEPLTSFDLVAAHDIKQLLISIKSETIIIFSTHIMPLARELCDEIVLLHQRTLEQIDAVRFQSPEFEEEIIQLLAADIEGAS